MENIKIEPVTDMNDLPEIARNFDISLRQGEDDFYDVLCKYSESPYDSCLRRTKDALKSDQDFVFKAVDTRTGQIVGTCHWFIGYIDLPKVDPFAKQEGGVEGMEVGGEKMSAAMMKVKAPTAEDPVDFYVTLQRPARNAYIYFIQGKKHVYLRTLAVIPEYQRQGIASTLLKWGTERADREKTVSYLNARPSGKGIYERAGWQVMRTNDIKLPGYDIAPNISMMRPGPG